MQTHFQSCPKYKAQFWSETRSHAARQPQSWPKHKAQFWSKTRSHAARQPHRDSFLQASGHRRLHRVAAEITARLEIVDRQSQRKRKFIAKEISGSGLLFLNRVDITNPPKNAPKRRSAKGKQMEG